MQRKARNSGEIVLKNYSKKSLDSPQTAAYSPAPVAVVTAAVTGEEIGKRRGNVKLEGSNRRLSCCH